jgi:hypothetical protein
MKNLLATLLILISTGLSAQTLSVQGCDLAGSVAASSAMEAQGKAEKGSTASSLEMMLPRASDPGRAWEYFDYLIKKYSKSKESPDKIYEKEFKNCISKGGDLDKILPRI